MEKEKENVPDMHMGKLVHMLSNQLKRRDSMEAGPSDLTHMQRLVLRFILLPTKKAEGYREKILENIRENEARMEQGISREDYEACKLVLWKVFENLMEEEKKEERRRRDESKTISINP